MNKVHKEELIEYVEANIGIFHQKRIESLNSLKLDAILKRKNPYLFKAKFYENASDIVEALVSAFLSSQEETFFGNWLEGLAIYINSKAYGGRKSGIEGIDLEFENDGIRYIVTIKSGPNWGNSSQILKMKDNFNKAARILRTSNARVPVQAINGCCYGKDDNYDKGEYHKLCGQRFWEFISGDENLYLDIIEPLGHKAKEQKDGYMVGYHRQLNKFTADFIQKYCLPDGAINWEQLVFLTSKTK